MLILLEFLDILLSFFLKASGVFSRLLEFSKKNNMFVQIMEENAIFLRVSHNFFFFSNFFGLKIHETWAFTALKMLRFFFKFTCLKFSEAQGF